MVTNSETKAKSAQIEKRANFALTRIVVGERDAQRKSIAMASGEKRLRVKSRAGGSAHLLQKAIDAPNKLCAAEFFNLQAKRSN